VVETRFLLFSHFWRRKENRQTELVLPSMSRHTRRSVPLSFKVESKTHRDVIIMSHTVYILQVFGLIFAAVDL